ncbi:MAG: ABC transporter ATP-binding protein [Eubacteriales bacterium]|nr:ABC transporter ATP-binding protein [Eubacteriales bacterium]
MWKLIKRNLLSFFLMLVFAALSIATSMKFELLKGDVLNSVLEGQPLALTGPLPKLLIFLIISLALTYLYYLIRVHFQERASFLLRMDFFRSFYARRMREFQSLSKSEVVALYANHVATIDREYLQTLCNLVFRILTVAFAAITLLNMHFKLGLVFIAMLALPLFVPPIIEKAIVRRGREYTEVLTTFTESTDAYLKAFELIKNMSIEGIVGRQFNEANERLCKEGVAFGKIQAVGVGFSFIGTLVGQVAAAAFAAYLVYSGELDPGQFFSVLSIGLACSAPLFWIAKDWQALVATAPARDRYLKFTENLKQHLSAAAKPELPTGYTIEFKHVEYGFSSTQPLLDDFSITIPENSKCLIYGPSGSGKSTLVNLLLNYYPLAKGEVTIGNTPVSEIGDVSPVVSISRQEAVLLSDTMRNNLCLYQPGVDDESIFKVLRDLGLGKWANKEGLELQLDNQGSNVSGGEKKRLSLARSLLRDTPILVLDEPLANIDSDNIRKIEEHIAGIDKRTVIVISHQISAEFRQAFDQIIEFKGGSEIEVFN